VEEEWVGVVWQLRGDLPVLLRRRAPQGALPGLGPRVLVRVAVVLLEWAAFLEEGRGQELGAAAPYSAHNCNWLPALILDKD